ncbi:MAG: tRNA 2-thiouridine(34) synthase MnmA [Victivallales bacterium]|nr:tRNA 2-thiouridine(34) synthase MnmA [Victivallales bacterium]
MKSPEKVIVAMSGGVDSSVAAWLYRERGAEVIGVTLRLQPDHIPGLEGCLSRQDEEYAAAVARQLGIRHEILDFSGDFVRDVLQPSWEEFAGGRTPNPCTICNPRIKFGKLLQYADQIGAARVVTGHYVELVECHGRRAIRRGHGPNKDQSYFLFGLTQPMLARLDFPVGTMAKTTVRQLAQQAGLVTCDKKDSQDTCFAVPGESFQESLRRMFHAAMPEGDIVSTDGRRLGRHCGIHQFTLGQRKGLGVAMGAPAYVTRIDPKHNTVTLSTDERELARSRFRVTAINWQSGNVPATPFPALIQIRYRSRAVAGRIIPDAETGAEIELAEPLRAVTPGQAAVFYDRDLLLGGGFINNLED